jgi:multidrug transporter EmrE-like cation transporter
MFTKVFFGIFFSTLYAIFNVTGAAIIKAKLKNSTLINFNDWLGFLFSFTTVGAFALIFVSALFMFKALSTLNFTFIMPIATGINFMFTIFVGYYFFKDKVNYLSLLGFLLILSGIVLLSINNFSNEK